MSAFRHPASAVTDICRAVDRVDGNGSFRNGKTICFGEKISRPFYFPIVCPAGLEQTVIKLATAGDIRIRLRKSAVLRNINRILLAAAILPDEHDILPIVVLAFMLDEKVALRRKIFLGEIFPEAAPAQIQNRSGILCLQFYDARLFFFKFCNATAAYGNDKCKYDTEDLFHRQLFQMKFLTKFVSERFPIIEKQVQRAHQFTLALHF